ncbi:MAG TPA: metalloregulator ArsR/SmtB family transcription factor [Rubrobacteraceae bacterium]|nr:metalloregulator ArsR/SmtB family transcription factor [Rubrobacteraceae bacterium]
MASRRIEVVEENGVRHVLADGISEERVEHLVALGRALSDPIRVRMLGMMAEGRSCCSLPDLGAPVSEGDEGICVCEFEDYFGMGQSKVSYHLRKLKDAGLIREEKRGKWSFYSVDGEAVRELLGDAAAHLGVPEE